MILRVERRNCARMAQVMLKQVIIFDEEKSLADFQGTLKEFEMMLLKKRLDEFGGNKSLVAESLGVSVRWVQMKIKEIE